MRRAAVFASAIIGEASYKTAADLGIDPDPSSGGTDSGVTYIFFKNATISPDREPQHRGQELARTFIDNN
jgi:hypothetical protein